MSRADKFTAPAAELSYSQCTLCKHLAAGDAPVAPGCRAFPGGIPAAILANEADHRRPIEGDEGMGEPGHHVLFTPRDDAPPQLLLRLYAELDRLHLHA